jgi:uncharacterized GH25 family protein
MKRAPVIILVIAVAFLGIAATTHDFFLLPEFFFMHKGDKLNLHLVEGDQFVKQAEIGYQQHKTTKFMLYTGSKKVDLMLIAKDSAKTLVDYTMENSGQALLDMNRGTEYSDATRDNFSDFLTAQGYDKLAEKIKSSNQFRIKEKHTRYLKTLIAVDNHDGNAYEKVLNDDFEIVLKDNPYNKKYGDDMSALVKLKGKPAEGVNVNLYIKGITGNVYPQNLTTDKEGEVTFTMSREGIFMLRAVLIVPTTDKDADFVSWWASYTFPFSSTDEMPNTYKEFGFGNIH